MLWGTVYVHDPGTVRSPRAQRRKMKVSIDAYVALGLTVSQANPGITCRQTTGRGAGVDLRPCGLARHPNNDHYFVNFTGLLDQKATSV